MIKRALLAVVLCGLPGLCYADVWKYELKDALIEKVGSDGKKTHAINVEVIDYYINRIAEHAREYPPKFRDEQQKQEVVEKLRQLLSLLDILGENQQNNPEYLRRAAFANSMGHNLDIPESSAKAMDFYRRLLKVEPESKLANYYYGMFLVGTRKYHFDGIPFLEKALALGVEDARFTLGLLQVERGKTEEGLRYLETYAKNTPDNQHVRKVIEGVKNGNLKFHAN